MSPTFLYLGNPEELRDGVGDIFALKLCRTRISKWCRSRIWKPRSICAIDQKKISLSLKIVRKMTFAISFLKFLKNLNFSMTMRSWALVMLPLFSVSDPLLEKLTIFSIWPNLKLSIFKHQGAFSRNSPGDKVLEIDKINTFYPWHFFKKRQDNAGSSLASFQLNR